MTKVYKYRGGNGIFNNEGKSLFERDITTLVNNQIYLPQKSILNDPTEGLYDDYILHLFFNIYNKFSSNVEKQYNNLIKKINNVGIYSLSKIYDNELLWAYYASGHTGFVIEYDLDILENSLNYNKHVKQFYKLEIEYLKKIPQINISIFNTKIEMDILKKYIGTKSLSWSHEKELRLIFETTGLFEIDYRAITAIYFGYRMPENDIDNIMDKLKGRNLKYYKMINIKNTYKFEAKQIKDKYFDAPKYVVNKISYDIDKLLSEGIFTEMEKSKYRKYFIKAFDIIQEDFQVKEIYLIAISYENQTPTLKIFCNTKSFLLPIKSFEFKINENKELIQIK